MLEGGSFARYAAPDVLFVYAGYLMGESYLHNSPCIFDPHAKREMEELGITGLGSQRSRVVKEGAGGCSR